jgi:hypothetical protein
MAAVRFVGTARDWRGEIPIPISAVGRVIPNYGSALRRVTISPGGFTTPEREKLIRSVWENIGRSRWSDEVHGKGVSLFVPILNNMRSGGLGQPIEPPEELEFRLLSPSMSGHPLPAIVCDGGGVEEWRPPASR